MLHQIKKKNNLNSLHEQILYNIEVEQKIFLILSSFFANLQYYKFALHLLCALYILIFVLVL